MTRIVQEADARRAHAERIAMASPGWPVSQQIESLRAELRRVRAENTELRRMAHEQNEFIQHIFTTVESNASARMHADNDTH